MRCAPWIFAAVLLAWPGGARADDRPTVAVTTTAQLYAAVYGAPPSGSRIVLAAGVYELAATLGPASTKGRLDLPPYTDLIGEPGAIIDASKLPGTSFRFTTASNPVTGPVRAGLENRIEGLTIRNAIKSPANVAAVALLAIDRRPAEIQGLVWVGGLRATVIGNRFENGPRGVDARHLGTDASGLDSRIVIEGNTATSMANNEAGQGFRVIVTGGTSGSRLRVRLRDNVSTGNQIGLLCEILNSSNNVIEVESSGNVYEGNGLGVSLGGGAGGNVAASHDNELTFRSRGDAIRGNDLASTATFLPRGGAYVIGGSRGGSDPALTSPSTGNRVRATFLHTSFVKREPTGALSASQNRLSPGGARHDFSAWGAANGPLALFPGSDNVVEVLIRGADADAGDAGTTFFAQLQRPPPGATIADGDNLVSFRGSEVAFETTNDGADAPPGGFFPPESTAGDGSGD
jgi:hypothetical protein